MRVLLFSLIVLLLVNFSVAQNVGIGTLTPQATLDVKGNQRTGGVSHFLDFDSASGKFTWSGSSLWVTSPQYLMMHSASSEGLYYGSSQLEYRNSSGNPVFFTNWGTGNTYISNELGIGTSSPGFPLNFASSFGDKISLYGNSGSHFGFGIQNNLLQVHTNSSSADIAFGFGSSASFTEKFRMKGNGTLRAEGPSSANSGIPALSIGGYGDVQIDAFGSVGGRLTIKENGAFMIGGSTGNMGQVLQSNGSSSPSWISSTNSLYNKTVQVIGSAGVSINADNTWTQLPGMTYTFSTAGNARALVLYNVDVFAGLCFSCGVTVATMGVFVDGALTLNVQQGVANGCGITMSNSYLAQLGPGSHTVDLRGQKSGPAAYFSSLIGGHSMIIQIIPE